MVKLDRNSLSSLSQHVGQTEEHGQTDKIKPTNGQTGACYQMHYLSATQYPQWIVVMPNCGIDIWLNTASHVLAWNFTIKFMCVSVCVGLWDICCAPLQRYRLQSYIVHHSPPMPSHRIYCTHFRYSRGENHSNRIWAQNSAFLSRYQVLFVLKSYWNNTESEYLYVLTMWSTKSSTTRSKLLSPVGNDFSMFKGGIM